MLGEALAARLPRRQCGTSSSVPSVSMLREWKRPTGWRPRCGMRSRSAAADGKSSLPDSSPLRRPAALLPSQSDLRYPVQYGAAHLRRTLDQHVRGFAPRVAAGHQQCAAQQTSILALPCVHDVALMSPPQIKMRLAAHETPWPAQAKENDSPCRTAMPARAAWKGGLPV